MLSRFSGMIPVFPLKDSLFGTQLVFPLLRHFPSWCVHTRATSHTAIITFNIPLLYTPLSGSKYIPHTHCVVDVVVVVVVVVFLALQPIVVVFSQPGSGLQPPRFRGFVITHNDAPQSVGLLRTSDQSVTETST